jgi:hypothetical protein
MDGDGKRDVVCSASKILGTDSFIAFQNKDHHWQVVNNVASLGDGVDVISIDGKGAPSWWEQTPLMATSIGIRTPVRVSPFAMPPHALPAEKAVGIRIRSTQTMLELQRETHSPAHP